MWFGFYLTAFPLKIDLRRKKKQKNIKPTKRWAESKTLKAERVNYDSLSYKNREKLFKESSEIAVFGYFKQQHELDLSVTIRQHLMLEKII